MATQAVASTVGRLIGKVIFVTGAAQGIGRATALVSERACREVPSFSLLGLCTIFVGVPETCTKINNREGADQPIKFVLQCTHERLHVF